MKMNSWTAKREIGYVFFLGGGRMLRFGLTKGRTVLLLLLLLSFLHIYWGRMSRFWIDERTDGVAIRFEAATGHYTAVVWAETSRVGCGFSTYRQNGRLTNLYVCNYGPAGNFIGQPVYKTGRGCSQCAPNFACSAQFANLCGQNLLNQFLLSLFVFFFGIKNRPVRIPVLSRSQAFP